MWNIKSCSQDLLCLTVMWDSERGEGNLSDTFFSLENQKQIYLAKHDQIFKDNIKFYKIDLM